MTEPSREPTGRVVLAHGGINADHAILTITADGKLVQFDEAGCRRATGTNDIARAIIAVLDYERARPSREPTNELQLSAAKPTREQRLYDALKHIAAYDLPERLKKRSERDYGLDGDEAVEMAYENVLTVAKSTIKGMRRP